MSDSDRIYIIAEAGDNHNGSLRLARKMVDVAFDAGADAVKFQTFRAEDVISRFAPKARYQELNTGIGESQLDMAKKLELSEAEFRELFNYCKGKPITFLSTPFDLASADFLAELGLDTLKIASGEITNLPLLRKIGALKKNILMSTGMADLDEIAVALAVLTEFGTAKQNITILHCNTQYPASSDEVNLLAMNTIKKRFGTDVGYSDHTTGVEIPIAAVALGAKVIEKHFTLDKSMEGPDHKASLDPDELNEMVKAIRKIEAALGNGIKRPSRSEQINKPVVRRSIVAAKDIKKGQTFTIENIAAKRPGTGLSPMMWDEVIGKTAQRDFAEDSLIEI